MLDGQAHKLKFMLTRDVYTIYTMEHMHHGKNVGGGVCRNVGEVHKFPLQKASTASAMSKEVFLCTSNVVKSVGGRGSALDPAGGANYSAPSDPLAGGEGAGCPSPKTPSQFSDLLASNLVAFGHCFHAP